MNDEFNTASNQPTEALTPERLLEMLERLRMVYQEGDLPGKAVILKASDKHCVAQKIVKVNDSTYRVTHWRGVDDYHVDDLAVYLIDLPKPTLEIRIERDGGAPWLQTDRYRWWRY